MLYEDMTDEQKRVIDEQEDAKEARKAAMMDNGRTEAEILADAQEAAWRYREALYKYGSCQTDCDSRSGADGSFRLPSKCSCGFFAAMLGDL